MDVPSLKKTSSGKRPKKKRFPRSRGLPPLETFRSLMCLPNPVSRESFSTDRINAKIADISEALVNVIDEESCR
ncbi:hypothetical protein TNCV_1384291 [Trichonephila clavipes]|nr:hypothetical protein TNCV_1384291 [Trichonephila clavipes]